MTTSKLTSEPVFRIAFKTPRFRFRSERHHRLNFPRSVLRCMWTFPAIVLGEPAVEIARYAAVMQLIVRFADEYVNVMEAFHRTVAFAKRSWVKKAGLPSRSLAALKRVIACKPASVLLRRGSPSLLLRCERRLEARGVEPLSSSLSTQTSTCLSDDKF